MGFLRWTEGLNAHLWAQTILLFLRPKKEMKKTDKKKKKNVELPKKCTVTKLSLQGWHFGCKRFWSDVFLRFDLWLSSLWFDPEISGKNLGGNRERATLLPPSSPSLTCPWASHLTSNCSSRAARWPDRSDCGCPRQLPDVNVFNCVGSCWFFSTFLYMTINLKG